jgi:small-conductance mechanosensitive channel
VWGVGVTALRILDAVLHRITLRFVGEIDDKRGRDEREFYTSIYALRRLIILLMVGVALLVVLAQLNLFDSVGLTLLASAGVLTVVFGIAGQAVLGNILASLQIAFAKPVRIGDSVLFEGNWAYVEAIFYTFLRLRTWDHRRIVVPVTYFVSKPFENWSVAEARMMKVIDLRLDHRADMEILRTQFDKLVREDADISESDSALTMSTGHTADGLQVSFFAMMDDPSTGWMVQCRLRERMTAFVRDNHPAWFPRERVQEVGHNGPDSDPSAGASRIAGTS